MSQMIEVYLSKAKEAHRSEAISLVVEASGRLTYEESHEPVKSAKGICLTFEFDSLEMCQKALKNMAARGFYTEGPYDY